MGGAGGETARHTHGCTQKSRGMNYLSPFGHIVFLGVLTRNAYWFGA